MRGREPDHPEIAVNLLRQVAEALSKESKLEQAPNLEGRFMSIIVAPVKITHSEPVSIATSTEG